MRASKMKVQHGCESLVCLLMGLTILACVLLLPSCKTGMPSIEVSFWAGDSARNGITRAQENKFILASDPQFDGYVALTYEDLQRIYYVLQQCKDWGKAEMTEDEMNTFMVQNPRVYEYVTGKKPLPKATDGLESI